MTNSAPYSMVSDHPGAFYQSTDDVDTVMSPINITGDIHGLSPHRSAKQWQQLIDRHSRSSQSAREFCTDHDIGYASFIQWRSRLSPSTSSSRLTEETVPEFVELTSGLDEHRHHEVEQLDVASPILIELDLGSGLQLRISRGV